MDSESNWLHRERVPFVFPPTLSYWRYCTVPMYHCLRPFLEIFYFDHFVRSPFLHFSCCVLDDQIHARFPPLFCNWNRLLFTCLWYNYESHYFLHRVSILIKSGNCLYSLPYPFSCALSVCVFVRECHCHFFLRWSCEWAVTKDALYVHLMDHFWELVDVRAAILVLLCGHKFWWNTILSPDAMLFNVFVHVTLSSVSADWS